MNTRAIWKICGMCTASAVLISLSGCIDPGSAGSDVLTRYHQALAEQFATNRGAAGTIDAYRPGPGQAAGPQLGSKNGRIYVSLNDAVMRALANNPSIKVVSYDPEIAYEEMVAAAAAFDVTVFGNLALVNNDMAPPPNNPFASAQSETRTFEAGASQRLPTGTTWQTTWGLTRSWSDFGTSPRTTWAPSVSFEIYQPLLRGAGTSFNLAELRIARLNYQVSQAEFRQNVEQLVFQVHQAYYQLIQAMINYEIQQQLLDVTQQTYERIKKRAVHDAAPVEVRQAEAAVATRRAVLVRARKSLQDARDRLAQLISDPKANLVTELEGIPLVPVTPLVNEQIIPNATDQLLLALENSPVLAQARQGIAVAAIGIDVAENQALPQVDLTASADWNEREFRVGEAIDSMGDFNYISFALALSVEYPLGNRLREAELRQARYRHLQSIASYQDAVDITALQIMERIRQIDISWQEMVAQAQAVEAAEAQLKALNSRERLIGQLTPEFLNVKLQAQQTLASARQGQLDAQTRYNVALIELAQVTGTLLDRSQVVMGPPRVPIRQRIEKFLQSRMLDKPAEPIDEIPDRRRFVAPEEAPEAPEAPEEAPERPEAPVEPGDQG
ncbi:MAG: TolC family protein [Phycisphaerae bacterium]